MKKKAGLKFEPAVIAILVLIVLIVCIAVFIMGTKGPLKGLFDTSDEVSEHTDKSINLLSLMFGRCDTVGETVCHTETLWVCNEHHKWMKSDDPC